MKKVININFSGRLINIEEDAYTQLQTYMESLKKYFSNEEGKEEIIADIENRIAEIFYDKQNKGLAAITTIEVDEIMATIGKPEDFGEPEEANTQNNSNASNASSEQKQYVNRGKLYRNANDKMLGGVCSGVATYFNIDIVLVRVIFAILLFGAGAGFFLYIILWIVLPESTVASVSMERKLFRNPEDKYIGGVAGGIASYFGIEAWIPRLIFGAPFILSVIKGTSALAYSNFFNDSRFWTFSFGGTTTVIYFLLLWIIPEAKTVQEKMAMKGEKMDLDSIKNNVQDSIKNFSEKANAWGRDITNKSNEWTRNNFGTTQENVARVNTIARSTGNKIGSGFGLLIKGFVLFICGIVAFSLLMALIGLLIGGAAIWPLKSFILENGWQTNFAWGSLLILIIPAIAFILWLYRKVFRVKTNIKSVKVVLGGLMGIGVICAIFLAANIASSFQYHNDSTSVTEISMTQPKDRLIVQVTEPEVVYSGELPWVNFDDNGFDITRDSLKYANVKIRIERSKDSLYHITVKKYSRGNTVKDAENRAQKIQFTYTQKDSILDLGSHIAISKEEKFRGQQVIVLIQIPKGRKIQFDETISEKLHPFTVRVGERYDSRRNRYRRSGGMHFDFDHHFEYIVNEDYIMNANGELELANKQAIEAKEANEMLKAEKERLERELEQTKEQRELEKEEKERQKEADKLNKEIEELQKKKEALDNKKVTSIINVPDDNDSFNFSTVFALIPFSV
jgi:phage shock protein PspC (stress-responsive transcriptional regulator)